MASREVTGLLIDWSKGNQAAFEELLPRVYEELRHLARHYLRHERLDHPLQTTALVHEAYFRLVDQANVAWQGRAHFFRAAAQAMRRILVDHARTLKAAKREVGPKVALEEGLEVSGESSVDLLEVDDALKTLEKFDSRKAFIVELRYFGGLSTEEIAESLGISPATVKREWVLAKAWLYTELGSG